MKETRQDYQKGPCCLIISRGEKATVSNLSLTLLGSLPCCSTCSQMLDSLGQLLPSSATRIFLPVCAGYPFPSRGFTACLKSGDCGDLNECIPLLPICTQRKTEQLLLFKSLFSFYCSSFCSGLFQTASNKPDLVLLGSLRSPEASLRAQD